MDGQAPLLLSLPANVVEASDRRCSTGTSKLNGTRRARRHWRIEQLLGERWLALTIPYYQPREAIAALLTEIGRPDV